MKISPFSTIGKEERANVLKSLKAPLSGYLGGVKQAGYWIEKLQHDWANEFGVEHAVACNSATSGLLAACLAVGISPGDTVWTTPYSMSATAACAAVLGAKLKFIDIESYSFGLDIWQLPQPDKPKAIIVTNLFGSAARDLADLATYCRQRGIYLIEDNAQSPYATHRGTYTGTFGHIGVFSLNVHKHMQCGEGGVCVTNDEVLASNLRGAINHGELANGRPGLNLRMTEPIAAIACAQLAKGQSIVARKIELGTRMSEALEPYRTRLRPPPTFGTHVYYVWAALSGPIEVAVRFAAGLKAAGLPARVGYAPILTDVFGSSDPVPTARDVDERIVCVDLCQIEPDEHQIRHICEIVKVSAVGAIG